MSESAGYQGRSLEATLTTVATLGLSSSGSKVPVFKIPFMAILSKYSLALRAQGTKAPVRSHCYGWPWAASGESGEVVLAWQATRPQQQ